MNSDLLTWKIFSLPISLNETSDQLQKDFLKKMVINLRLMDVAPILLLAQVFGMISLLILDLKMIWPVISLVSKHIFSRRLPRTQIPIFIDM